MESGEFQRNEARNSGTDVKPGEVFCGDCADMGGGVGIARLVDGHAGAKVMNGASDAYQRVGRSAISDERRA
jgi:hypothetical protein